MVAAAPGGVGTALAAGLLTLWAIFIPCFGLVFALAPHLERLTDAPRLSAGLSAVSAAVVGVIAALALYFAGHVLVPGGLGAGPDPVALVLTSLATIALVFLRLPLPVTLGALALCGWALRQLA